MWIANFISRHRSKTAGISIAFIVPALAVLGLALMSKYDAQMESFVNQLAALDAAEGAALGGKTVSQISKQLGHLVKMHPNEVIIPLDKTAEGSALKKLDKILNPSNAQLARAQA